MAEVGKFLLGGGAVDAVEPVVDHEYLIDISGHRIVGILDDEWGVQASVELEGGMRVEEVGPRVGECELVGERCAGIDRRLGEVVNAVHVITDGDAMPMNGRWFW